MAPLVAHISKDNPWEILWTILIGFVAGVIAKFIVPGPNEPSGFVLTAILGIVGAVLASYVGQALGWYSAGEGAGLIGAVLGAIVVLLIWGAVSRRRA
ncbi:GlsB/YeaQ/YmgE family stress response membrane protein [Devosia sp. CN2-171]|uniref:GlsB/YeaQ/YmgE family stress response membrane protein n=1 Tax=Devosia sp. CN2-171 TaxID=3400909 RepID=UPI003BF77432